MQRLHIKKMGVSLIEPHCTNQELPTGVCIVLSGKKDRGFCSHFGVSDAFPVDDLTNGVLASLEGLQHLHIGGFYSCATMRLGLVALMQRARAYGCSISLDTNFDATGEWGARDGLLTKVLPLVDFFLPNDSEAMKISRKETVEEAVVALGKLVRQGVVATCGPDGALGCFNGQVLRIPAVDLALAGGEYKVLDPVGAGDAFNAGFIASYVGSVAPPAERGTVTSTSTASSLHQDDFVRAVKQGCLAAALCITKRGASMDPPDCTELASFAAATRCL
jgi:sugar/nucleoside kinase (ribokinase family)